MFDLQKELEDKVIGALLLIKEVDRISQYMVLIKDYHFQTTPNRMIMEAISYYWNNKENISNDKIIDYLDKYFPVNHQITDTYLHNLFMVGHISELEYNLEKLNKYSSILTIRNGLKLYLDKIESKEIDNPDEAINELDKLKIDFTQSYYSKNIFSPYSLQDYESDLELSIDDIRIKSSLIDNIYYYKGSLNFIGARTGHGKTTFLINESINLSYHNIIAFISLEESNSPITDKLMTSLINNNQKNSLVLLEDYRKDHILYHEEKKTLFKNMKIFDQSPKIELLVKLINYCYKVFGIDTYFIDYIQRISFNDTYKSRLPRQEQIKLINSILLDLAKDNNLILIFGCQMNRTVGNPKNEDAIIDILLDNTIYREAGDIEQDAKLIINLWSDKSTNRFYYGIPKYRDGKSGNWGLLSYSPSHWLIQPGENVIFKDITSAEKNVSKIKKQKPPNKFGPIK